MKKTYSLCAVILGLSLFVSSCSFLQAIDDAAGGPTQINTTRTTKVSTKTGATEQTESTTKAIVSSEIASGEGTVASEEVVGSETTVSGEGIVSSEGTVASEGTAASEVTASGEGTTVSEETTTSEGTVSTEGTSTTTTKPSSETSSAATKSTAGTSSAATKSTTGTSSAATKSTTKASTTTTKSSSETNVCYQTIDSSLNLNDQLYFVYYSKLTDVQKKLYNELSNGLAHGKIEINLTGSYSDDQSFASEVIMALYYDQPNYFWVTPKCGLQSSNGKLKKVIYTNLCTNLDSAKTAFNQAVDTVLANTSGMSAYEYEKYVHDYLSKLISYGSNTYDQTAYGALVQKQSVCAGYARAFQYLMMKRGIPCYYVPGAGYSEGSTENHGWNMVYIEDGFYYVDVTWDDQESGPIYTYFNAEKNFFESTHQASYGSFFYTSSFGSKYMLENIYGDKDLYEAQNFANTNFGGGVTLSSLEDYQNQGFTDLVQNNFTGRTFICSSAVFDEICAYVKSDGFLSYLCSERSKLGLTGSFTFAQGYAYYEVNGYIVFTENHEIIQ